MFGFGHDPPSPFEKTHTETDFISGCLPLLCHCSALSKIILNDIGYLIFEKDDMFF